MFATTKPIIITKSDRGYSRGVFDFKQPRMPIWFMPIRVYKHKYFRYRNRLLYLEFGLEKVPTHNERCEAIDPAGLNQKGNGKMNILDFYWGKIKIQEESRILLTQVSSR